MVHLDRRKVSGWNPGERRQNEPIWSDWRPLGCPVVLTNVLPRELLANETFRARNKIVCSLGRKARRYLPEVTSAF